MKKNLYALLALAVSLAIIVACGSGDVIDLSGGTPEYKDILAPGTGMLGNLTGDNGFIDKCGEATESDDLCEVLNKPPTSSQSSSSTDAEVSSSSSVNLSSNSNNNSSSSNTTQSSNSSSSSNNVIVTPSSSSAQIVDPGNCTDISIDQTDGGWTDVTAGCKKIKCTKGGWGHSSSVACKLSSAPQSACTASDYDITITLNGNPLNLTLSNCWEAKKEPLGLTCDGTTVVTVIVPTGKTISCKGNE